MNEKKLKEIILSRSPKGEQKFIIEMEKKRKRRLIVEDDVKRLIKESEIKSKKENVTFQITAICHKIDSWEFSYKQFNTTIEILKNIEKKGFESEAKYWLNTAKNMAKHSEVSKEINNFEKYAKKAGRGYSFFKTSPKKLRKISQMGIENNNQLN